MWDLLAQTGCQGFNQSELQQRYALARQVLELLASGWSEEALNSVLLSRCELLDLRVGSRDFRSMWQVEKNRRSAKALLELFIRHLSFPLDLSGELTQNQALVTYFSPNLAPHDVFWWDLAGLVNQAFPKDSLCQANLLARQIHQLRYLISSQQAEYVRKHYKQAGQTDAEALAAYLKLNFPWWKRSSYRLTASARLHNKVKLQKGQKVYPSAYSSVNIKILVNWHTEFILDCQGNFLNEVDAQLLSENGIVNGASFNYGKSGKRHWQLDVLPVAQQDPSFRQQIKKGFRAPSRSRKGQSDYAHSYFNPKGYYAENGRSCYQLVRQTSREFAQLIRQLP